MEGSKRILSIVMAAVMVLSVFAGLAVIPASAAGGITVADTSIVAGEYINISIINTTAYPGPYTVKAKATSGPAEGTVVILAEDMPDVSGWVNVSTKDKITADMYGEYNLTVYNSTNALVGWEIISVAKPLLIVKIKDVEANKDDVSTVIKGHNITIHGTSNAQVASVKIFDENNIEKYANTNVTTQPDGTFNVTLSSDDLGTGTFTLEVKDKVDTKVTKTFQVVEAELNINVPTTAVLGNKVKIQGTSTDYGANVTVEITGPISVTLKNVTRVQSNGAFEVVWYAGAEPKDPSNATGYENFTNPKEFNETYYWMFKKDANLLGNYKVKVIVGDKDKSAYVEVVDPDVTISVPDEVVINKTLTVSGTSNRDDGTPIKVVLKDSDGDEIWNTTDEIDDGTWEVDIPDINISEEDTYTVEVIQDWNTSALKESASKDFEAKKPTVTLSAPEEVAYNNKVEITGSVSPNIGAGELVNITVKVSGTDTIVATADVTTDANGEFSWKWDTKQYDESNDSVGTFVIKARLPNYGDAYDEVTVRLVDPEIKIIEAPNVAVLGKKVEVKVWYDQPDGVKVALLVDGTEVDNDTIDDKEATLEWDTSDYFEGTYTLKVVGYGVDEYKDKPIPNIYDITSVELTEQSLILVVPDTVVAGEKAKIEAYAQVKDAAVKLKITGNNIDTLLVSGTADKKETSGDYEGWYKVNWNTLDTKFEGGYEGKWNTSYYDDLSSDKSKIIHLAPGVYTVELIDQSTGNKVTKEITVVNPTLELTSPEDGKAFAIGDEIKISGTTNKEDGTRIHIYITSADGNYDEEFVATVADGTFEKTWRTSGRAAGEYTIKVVYKWAEIGDTREVNASDDVVDQVTIELKPAVADIQVTSVDVSPSEVKVGETATVTAVVKNLGVAEGTETITFSVNGVATMQEEVTLAPGESTTLTFEISKTEPGTYTIDVNGVSKTLTVTEEVTPTATPTETTPAPTPEQPGFEAVFAIVGLLAVAYLVLRQKEE